jgi:16S rRNA (uracil1498-N3)-methyltransferase
VTIGGEDARHLLTVLRSRPGDPISLSDGAGTRWQARLAETGRGEVVVDLVEPTVVPRPVPRVEVVHALPKRRKLDEVVQRLVEVGVDRIVPVHSERSQVRLDAARAAKAAARWNAVAEAAAKQSRRAWLPVVEPAGEWTAAFPAGVAGVVLWEESDVALRTVLDSLAGANTLVLGVGPEGGLTAAEVQATGLAHATLGEIVLRTETAALVAVSALRYHFGLMA